MHMPSIDVIQAIAVTAELCGRTFSPAAARVFAGDLDGFPDAAVLSALTRCRKEVKGLLTVQAWAMLPQDEETSTVWTEEMAQAWGVASPLLVGGDRIGARMAFKEAYAKAVTDARDRKLPPKWTPSFGRDVPGRQAALAEAVRHNRLSLENAVQLLPYDAAEGLVRSLGARHPLLAGPSVVGQTRVKALLAGLKGQAA
jgi:hypothetical protein